VAVWLLAPNVLDRLLWRFFGDSPGGGMDHLEPEGCSHWLISGSLRIVLVSRRIPIGMGVRRFFACEFPIVLRAGGPGTYAPLKR
jgi:hypothetical protein